ncbi:hypothetical protein MBLNU459_g8417t1 [Dothideomycetes sp. NU459]
MHQHPRPAPRSAASPNTPQTNPQRTNNERDRIPSRSQSTQDMPAEAEKQTPDLAQAPRSPDQELRTRLNQVVQRFFSKAALIILSSRVSLPPAILKNGDAKIDRWFNTFVEDTDVLSRDLQAWSSLDISRERPSALVLEVYLDTAQLAQNQTLVALDEDGNSWDVSEALQRINAAAPSPAAAQGSSGIVYERWTIRLDDAPAVPNTQLADHAPNVYKKGVVLMRSLFTYARLLPAWRFGRRLGRQAGNAPSLRPRYRIVDSSLSSPPHLDSLTHPLFPSDKSPTETYNFVPISCLFGSLNVSVRYRKLCDFHAESSERLLSQRMWRRSEDQDLYPDSSTSSQSYRGSAPTAIHRDDRPSPLGRDRSISSVEQSRQRPAALDSSVHAGAGGQDRSRAGSLRAQGIPSSLERSSGSYRARPLLPDQGQYTSGRSSAQEDSAQARDSLVRNPSSFIENSPSPLGGEHSSRGGTERSLGQPVATSFPRRQSASFQPFKAGSLSSSPKMPYLPASPGGSVGRGASNPLYPHTRNPSLSTLPQQALRNPILPQETAITSSASSSPKPAPLQRYSSSFSNRKARFPSSVNSRTEEDNLSSGRGSISSTHRASSTLPEGEGLSSGSMPTDEDNIADFLKLLDKNKGLPSFNKNDQASLNANSQRTAAQYSKFARMRESTTQLSESMSSSLMLQRSSSSPGRQLHNIPGMIAGSASTSSSPGKPISPHTPHMPAIPSRLSNNSIVADYSRDRSRSRPADLHSAQGGSGAAGVADARSPSGGHGTPASTAIDIPTSPRTFPAGRRSSSVAQQARVRPEIEEPDALPFGLRSASLPNEERSELSLSELLMQTESGTNSRRRRDLAVADDDDEPLLFALQAE